MYIPTYCSYIRMCVHTYIKALMYTSLMKHILIYVTGFGLVEYFMFREIPVLNIQATPAR